MAVSISSMDFNTFRNIEDGRIALHPSTTIVAGPNGAGKTNVLEAICLVAAGYSPRTRIPADLPRHGHEEMTLAATINTHTATGILGMTAVRGRRLSHRIVPDAVVPITSFSPDDLSLVKAGPACRRRYLDEILFQLSPAYRHHWRRYRAALAQRNAVLKAVRGRRASKSDLLPWTEQLLTSGAVLTAERAAACLRLEQRARTASDDIATSPTDTTVEYAPAASATREEDDETRRYTAEQWRAVLADRFEQSLADDIAAGTTGGGPHRDDVILRLAGRTARDFASQGQQRTMALALRMAQLTELEDAAGEAGIILLDDVASELDQARRTRLPGLIAGRQAVITVTEASLVPGADLVLSVCAGKVTS